MCRVSGYPFDRKCNGILSLGLLADDCVVLMFAIFESWQTVDLAASSSELGPRRQLLDCAEWSSAHF